MISYGFLFSLPLLLTVYYRIPGNRRWWFLLAASAGFYLHSGARYLGFLLFTAVSVYMTAGRCRGRKGLLCGCLTANFLLLAVCKIGLTVPLRGLDFLSLGLPLGMSFYLFGAAGYLLDVYRGRQEPERNFGKFFLFLTWFPQLIQGPVTRFSQVSRSLFSPAPFDARQVSFGIQRMAWGYFKKLVLADRMALAVLALRDPRYLGAGFFTLTLFYGIQIYCDFTGGMDMVLGLSQAFGVTLPENFRRPFFSKNTAEYWRRWHMTLGAWMKDYVFYPLSVSAPMRKFARFSRKQWGAFGRRLPIYLASLVTWIVTGLWHGITPNFLLWGLLNWLVITVSQELTPLFRRFHDRFGWKEKPWYGGFEILRMTVLMDLIRACDLFPRVGEYFSRLGSLVTAPSLWFFTDGSLLTLGLSGLDYTILLVGCLMLLGVSVYQEKRGSVRERLWALPVPVQYMLFLGLVLAILLLGRYGVGYDAAAFIYNQF